MVGADSVVQVLSPLEALARNSHDRMLGGDPFHVYRHARGAQVDILQHILCIPSGMQLCLQRTGC